MPEDIRNDDPIRIGDYIIYNDGRDSYAGTVAEVDEARNWARIKVVILVKDEQQFTFLEVPLNRLRKRTLI